LARVLVTATEDELAARDTSVGLGPTSSTYASGEAVLRTLGQDDAD